LDDEEAVPVGIADEELRRNRIVDGHGSRDEPRPGRARAGDLRVDVDGSSAQGRVGALDVGRGERTTGHVTARGSALALRDQGDRFAAPGGATSIQRCCPPYAKSARFSNPSVPTKNSNERSWSETGTKIVPISLMAVPVPSWVMLHSFTWSETCI